MYNTLTLFLSLSLVECICTPEVGRGRRADSWSEFTVFVCQTYHQKITRILYVTGRLFFSCTVLGPGRQHFCHIVGSNWPFPMSVMCGNLTFFLSSSCCSHSNNFSRLASFGVVSWFSMNKMAAFTSLAT